MKKYIVDDEVGRGKRGASVFTSEVVQRVIGEGYYPHKMLALEQNEINHVKRHLCAIHPDISIHSPLFRVFQ